MKARSQLHRGKRIPFSPVRFGKDEGNQEWGLQVTPQLPGGTRLLGAGKDWMGGRFGTLTGIEGISPQTFGTTTLRGGQLRTGGKLDADDPFSSKTDRAIGLDRRA
jgi:hypothetical protein